MYAIATYFQAQERRRAASVVYDHTSPDGAPITQDGYCPLGIMLKECMPSYNYDKRPSAGWLADFLMMEREDGDIPTKQVEDDARRFITAWDAGKITNLATALGV